MTRFSIQSTAPIEKRRLPVLRPPGKRLTTQLTIQSGWLRIIVLHFADVTKSGGLFAGAAVFFIGSFAQRFLSHQQKGIFSYVPTTVRINVHVHLSAREIIALVADRTVDRRTSDWPSAPTPSRPRSAKPDTAKATAKLATGDPAVASAVGVSGVDAIRVNTAYPYRKT